MNVSTFELQLLTSQEVCKSNVDSPQTTSLSGGSQQTHLNETPATSGMAALLPAYGLRELYVDLEDMYAEWTSYATINAQDVDRVVAQAETKTIDLSSLMDKARKSDQSRQIVLSGIRHTIS